MNKKKIWDFVYPDKNYNEKEFENNFFEIYYKLKHRYPQNHYVTFKLMPNMKKILEQKIKEIIKDFEKTIEIEISQNNKKTGYVITVNLKNFSQQQILPFKYFYNIIQNENNILEIFQTLFEEVFPSMEKKLVGDKIEISISKIPVYFPKQIKRLKITKNKSKQNFKEYVLTQLVKTIQSIDENYYLLGIKPKFSPTLN